VPLACFDLDNTLIDRAASFLLWATGFASSHGLEPAQVTWLAGHRRVAVTLARGANVEQARERARTAAAALTISLYEEHPWRR
jgi:phosphoserine phosphatase